MATWRSGYAAVCKTVYTSSILVVASNLLSISKRRICGPAPGPRSRAARVRSLREKNIAQGPPARRRRQQRAERGETELRRVDEHDEDERRRERHRDAE